MKHLGDITKLKGSEVPLTEIVVGGSPCQDLSVAGKRAGLAGARSGLFMEQIRLIKEMRENDRKNGRTDEHIRPRYMVWENVPGAFSSNKGEDFRAVLEETAKVAEGDACIPGSPNGKWPHAGCIMGDGWSIAWRVHDAQFWGVPQRRKRIALVADFGGESAPEILFERKGLSGDIEESGETGKGVATDAGAGIEKTSSAISFQERAGKPGGGKGILIQDERTGALSTLNNQSVCCLNDQGGSVMGVSENVVGALRAQEHGHQPLVFEPGAASRLGGYCYNDMCGTLRADMGDNQPAVCLNSWDVQSKHIQPENGIAESLYAGECRGGGGESYVMQSQVKEWCDAVNAEAKHQQDLIQSDLGVARTLAPGTHASGPHLTKTLITSKVYGISSFDSNAMKSDNPKSGIYEAETARTIDNNGGNPACNQGGMAVVQAAGVDTYNQTMDVEVAQPLRAADGGDSTPKVVCIEGNGSRPSHRGDGYSESETMYTLNSTEHHAVAVENHPADSRVKVSDDGMVQTLSGRMGTGGNNVPMVMEEPYNATICNSVVRRLTPLECERLQGFPTVRKVKFTEMTKDEYIAWNISEGQIVVDTEYGKVFATRGPGGVKLDEPKELTGTILNGYRVVSIRNGETKMQCRVHRIVWIAEHGVIPDGYVIDHINNDKQDNRLCNLQLLTAVENSTKARADGLYKIHGEAGQAKITDEVHDFIQYVYGNTDLSIRQLSEIFGISKSRVHQIIHDEAWTDIGEWYDSKGKKHKDADSPRYKALGNSIALPFWQWMAERMVKQLKQDGFENPTMASLFDGIGGFPLVFSRNGCKPIWASEIEEFPIAVTKIRFSEENK